jgi:hypothetical protein
MARWTDFVIAHRGRIIALWLVVFVLGGVAAANLGGLLSNRFSVPGSESERGLNVLKDHMDDRSDGSFTLVATGVDTAADRAAVAAAAWLRHSRGFCPPHGHAPATAIARGRRHRGRTTDERNTP